MQNYDTSNLNLQNPQVNMMNMMRQPQVQFPYGSNNMLLNNSPYDNYMGNRRTDPQDLLSHQFLKCRPVSSKEEARAYQIDLDGSLWVFTDLGNNQIYTKQVNNDGTATFKTYAFTEDENPYNSTDYVTKEEFNKVIQSLMAAIQPAHSQESAPVQSNNNSNNGNATLVSF